MSSAYLSGSAPVIIHPLGGTPELRSDENGESVEEALLELARVDVLDWAAQNYVVLDRSGGFVAGWMACCPKTAAVGIVDFDVDSNSDSRTDLVRSAAAGAGSAVSCEFGDGPQHLLRFVMDPLVHDLGFGFDFDCLLNLGFDC